ncbi:MAG: hypothetical protein KGJ57_21130, partial [Sphingomonadales bacterium]|nr:hypothetical protein [Sphingomonadales bacterium]
MNDVGSTTAPKVGAYVKGWLIFLVVLAVSSFVLDRFDTFTVITPDNSGSLNICFGIAGLAGFANAILGWRMAAKGQLRGGRSFFNQLMAGFGFLILGFLPVLFAVVPVVNIIQAKIEFPAAATKTFRGKLLISRAYEMHGKGRSWHIQTQPIWTDIEITQEDFGFLQSHRRPDDLYGKPDEIRSDGYFCANVMLQSAGDALRVMNAGSVERHAKLALTHIPCNSGHAGAITLALSRSIFARPYICRFINLRR